MKKVLLAAALMITSAAAFAQHEVGSFNLQPKVGMNVAMLTNYEKDGTSDPRIGFVGGLEGEYQATDIFSVSAGVLYSMQGAKKEVKALNTTYTATTKVDYINIPVMANVYVVKGLAVKAGIQPGFKVSSSVKQSLDTPIGGASGSTDLKAKSFDFSIPVGISYEYANVQLDARYNFGVTKVFENSDIKNSVFQLTLGYKFDL